MSIIKLSKITNIDLEEYRRQISQIYEQLTRLEQTMKHSSLNDSLYFLQLAQKCFEKEIEQELQTYQ